MTAFNFQTGTIPAGFTLDEAGKLIHYKNGIVVAVPRANQSGWSGDAWLTFASAWGDVLLKVSWHDGTRWSGYQDFLVKKDDGRIGPSAKLPQHAQKIAIGRAKKNANDTEDDIPVSWLFEIAE
ncbi:hypothetical protein ACFU0X_35255 [Streptomyces cellulosae]|uniref:Uncharacterized protein n=1 Tax=Streptomyces cellulosae TaxID=1968 RepID=A0ABW6JS49_STRCE